jgi:transcriptional regulator with XRE-family HTH domain
LAFVGTNAGLLKLVDVDFCAFKCTSQEVFVDLDAQRGARILEERRRLGLSQQAAADAAGIRREMWARYEGGAEPGAKALAGMAVAGADVLYILTGQRSQPVSASAISEGDRILLDNFHAAPQQVQAGVKTALGAFKPATGAKRGKAA